MLVRRKKVRVKIKGGGRISVRLIVIEEDIGAGVEVEAEKVVIKEDNIKEDI